MYVYNLTTLSGGEGKQITTQHMPVRRVILSPSFAYQILSYDNNFILRTTTAQGLYEITFDSYFGYPDSSHFKVHNYDGASRNVTILMDCLPDSNINPNYFTTTSTISNDPPVEGVN